MGYDIKKIKEEIANGKDFIRYSEYHVSEYGEDLLKADTKESEGENFNILFSLLEDCMEFKIDEKILERNADKINWRVLIRIPNFCSIFSDEFLRKFSDEIDWDNLIYYHFLNNEFIIKYKEYFNWNNLYLNRRSYKENEIREIESLVNDFTEIANFSDLSEEFLIEFRNKINWNSYAQFHKRSISFLKMFKQYVDWNEFIKYYYLSEEIVENFGDFIDWSMAAQYYYISERIYDKYSNLILEYNKKHRKHMLLFIEEEYGIEKRTQRYFDVADEPRVLMNAEVPVLR